MNAAQQSAWDAALEALLAVPWAEREKVCAALRYNGVFCWECGYGEPDHPNANCQCKDDALTEA